MAGKIPVISVLDVGKTNKKAFLFDEHYEIVDEQSAQFTETVDEDGYPCEDVMRLRDWVKSTCRRFAESGTFLVKALNVSAYGASFVHLDEQGEILSPLYNYLKPFPESLKSEFYKIYGGEETLSLQTASPVLGSLNSGLQLFRLKRELPDVFSEIKSSLHLPQYIAGLITGQAHSDITSIGCHTLLWDFTKQDYHAWVFEERIDEKLPPRFPSDSVLSIQLEKLPVQAGVGLHDSSAALIPYLAQFSEPFVLLSTGTWSISLNPFNHNPLTAEELQRDCLCYLDYKGKPVKASRLFAGYEHERQTKRLAEHFHVQQDFYKGVEYHLTPPFGHPSPEGEGEIMVTLSRFAERDLNAFKTFEEAYHQLIFDLVKAQLRSTELVIGDPTNVKRIFVDGGFSDNPVFMNMLARAFPNQEVYAASVHQASALGAALAIHSHWNTSPIPTKLIALKRYL